MLTLYYMSNTCSLASHIVLEEVGADYEAKRVDFSENAQRSQDYLAINPKGRVPTLVTDRGALTETPAILAFLAQNFPQAGLAPLNDPFAFAKLQAFNSYICSTLHVAHAHKVRGSRWADDDAAHESMRKKVPESVAACFELIENDMLLGPWVMGETYSIADPYLFTVAQWMEGDGIDPARFPRVIDHRNRMLARPAVARAIAAQG